MQYRGTDIAKQTGTYNTSGPEILAMSINLGSIVLLDRAWPRLFFGSIQAGLDFLIFSYLNFHKLLQKNWNAG